jgi:hypothetical protein
MTNNPAYTTPTIFGSPVTADVLAAQAPLAVRMLWQSGFDTFEQSNDYLAPMEGEGGNSIISVVRDMAAGKGSQITFTIATELGNEPHYGSQVFADSSHYEQLILATNTLWVDFVRHAIRFDQRTEEIMGMRGEITSFLDELQQGVPDRLGGWHGRLKTEQLFMMWLNIMPGDNQVTLSTPLNWFTIVNLCAQMDRNGAKPAMTARDPGGEPVNKYVIVADKDGLNTLENDPQFTAFIRDTKDVTGCKYLWTGGWPDVRGHSIRPHNGLFHDGPFAQGSPLKPLGILGKDITVTTATASAGPLRIYLGGTLLDTNNTFMKPSKWFPNYAFQWGPGTLAPTGSQPSSLAAGTKSFFVAVVNSSTAVTDPGKWSLYMCQDNDGVSMLVKAVLVDGATVVATAGTLGGPNLTTSFSSTNGSVKGDNIGTGTITTGSPSAVVAGVNVSGIGGRAGIDWSSSVNTNTNKVGAAVYMVGPDGVPLFSSLILSADACRRGYGKFRGQRVPDSREGGFIQERYFVSVFGQNLRTNLIGRYPGAIKMFHQGQIQGTPLPKP